jgi:hypothetical protein
MTPGHLPNKKTQFILTNTGRIHVLWFKVYLVKGNNGTFEILILSDLYRTMDVIVGQVISRNLTMTT